MSEISRTTWWLAAALTVIAAGAMAWHFGGQLGFWEPYESGLVGASFEAAELEVELDADGDEGRQSETVTIDSAPVVDGEVQPLSLIRTFWLSRVVGDPEIFDAGGVGDVERRARLPLMILLIVLLGATMLWARDHIDDGAAAMSAIVLATSPVVVLGSILLSGPLIGMAASALAIMAIFQSVYGSRWSIGWASAAALALSVVALDLKLVGVVATLAVVVALAVVEGIGEGAKESSQRRPSGRFHPAFGGLTAVGLGALAVWAVASSWGYDGGLVEPQVVKWLWVAGSAIALVGLSAAAIRTPMGRALMGVRGLILLAGGLMPLVAIGVLYASAMPAELSSAGRGQLAVGYLLEHYQFGGSVEVSGNFAWWWRQLGFGMFPHVIFLVPAVGFLVWKLGDAGASDPARRALARLCLVWPAVFFVVVAAASEFGHTQFAAYVPVAVAIGWMVSDSAFWRAMRRRPAMYFAVATVAVCTAVIMTHDPQDYPQRLIEFGIGGVEEPGLSDDFSVVDAVERWATPMLMAIIAYFVGAISWAVFTWRDMGRLTRWAVERWKRFRADADVDEEQPEDGSVNTDEDDEGRVASDPTDDGLRPGRRRMAEREDWRDADGVLARWAGRLERLPGLVGLVTIGGLGWVAVYGTAVVNDVEHDLSGRAVVETYGDVSDGEPLIRYRVDESSHDFYVRGLDPISDRRQFNDEFGGEDRGFALVDDEDFAEFHSGIRRDHDQSPVVLDSGGGLFLVSNQLAEGEVDINPISKYVLDEPDEDFISLGIEVDGEEQNPEFEGRIELLGYRLDRTEDGRSAVYAWGDTMEITQYFRVLRRVPGDREIFMHIDLGGQRIHGDHEPVDGLYPTGRWRAGDIIKNVHEVEIERFSTPGEYTIYTGFYDDERMGVEPDEAHDGEQRVEMTTIEVVAF